MLFNCINDIRNLLCKCIFYCILQIKFDKHEYNLLVYIAKYNYNTRIILTLELFLVLIVKVHSHMHNS